MRSRWFLLAIAVAVAMVVAGVLLFLISGSDEIDFGWFAYTPLDEESGVDLEFSGNAVLWSTRRVLGLGVGVLGLLVLAVAAGYRWGRRSASR